MGLRYVDYSRYAGWGASAPAPAPAVACAAPSWDGGDARVPAGGWASARDAAAEGARRSRSGAEREGRAAARPGALAAFWLLYESRDQRLSLFETRDGHLAAVDPARLV